LSESNRDILISKTSLSPSRYPVVYDGLLKYLEGSKITVDYYRKYENYTNKQTSDFTFSLDSNDVDISFDVIKNMEIVLESALSTEYNEESGEMEITGSGVIYPRLNPHVGDVFLYQLPDNLVGVFIVNNIKRLSISSGTAFHIDFHLYSFLDDNIDKKLTSNIKDIYYFDKQKFLGNDIPVLNRTDYSYLLDFRKKIKMWFNNWIELYYNFVYNSVSNTKIYSHVNENGEEVIDGTYEYYDPYIVEFIFNILETTDISINKKKLAQLDGDHVDVFFMNTFWNGLIEKDISLISFKYGIIGKQHYNVYDTNITSIINRYMLYLSTTNDLETIKKRYPFVEIDNVVKPEFYIFSDYFYTLLNTSDTAKILINDILTNDNLDPIEWLLINYFFKDNLRDIKDLLINTLDKEYDILNEQDTFKRFYYLPIGIFFLKVAIRLLGS
jgi:hypothetical protein